LDVSYRMAMASWWVSFPEVAHGMSTKEVFVFAYYCWPWES